MGKVREGKTYISTILEARENKPFILSEFDDRVCFLGGPSERFVDDHYTDRSDTATRCTRANHTMLPSIQSLLRKGSMRISM
jgi:hypothetical protein